MAEFFHSGGVIMWPMLLLGLAVLVLAGRAALRLRRPGDEGPARVEGDLRAILFWGAMSLVLGILGTTVGVTQMMQVIGMRGPASAQLIFGGLGVALITSIFGLLIFTVAAVLWFVLRQWHLRRAHHPSLAA